MKSRNDYIVLIDMDDTLVNLLDAWIDALNKKYNIEVNSNEIIDWDISKFFPSLTKHQVFQPLFDAEFWNTVSPKEGAVQYLKQLREDGYKVYVCTSTNYKIIKDKMDKVLFKYFDFLSWSDVIVTYNKQLVNADFLVDDGIHNLIGGKYKGILMDAPHNRNFNECEFGITRVKTWEEIYSLIKSMTE